MFQNQIKKHSTLTANQLTATCQFVSHAILNDIRLYHRVFPANINLGGLSTITYMGLIDQHVTAHLNDPQFNVVPDTFRLYFALLDLNKLLLPLPLQYWGSVLPSSNSKIKSNQNQTKFNTNDWWIYMWCTDVMNRVKLIEVKKVFSRAIDRWFIVAEPRFSNWVSEIVKLDKVTVIIQYLFINILV